MECAVESGCGGVGGGVAGAGGAGVCGRYGVVGGRREGEGVEGRGARATSRPGTWELIKKALAFERCVRVCAVTDAQMHKCRTYTTFSPFHLKSSFYTKQRVHHVQFISHMLAEQCCAPWTFVESL